jgi:CubicO group peptidase (beta-lactamase class C family)
MRCFWVGGVAGFLVFVAAVATPAEDRFDAAKLAQMDETVWQAIAQGQLPGGVLWLECRGSSYHKAYGRRAVVPRPEPMTEDTVFDVASLTKVLATAPAVMVLHERGRLHLDAPITAYLPGFNGGGREAITLRHLLTHTSGFNRALRRNPDWSDVKAVLDTLGAEPLAHAPGTICVYSDLNFIILGEVVQRVAGMKLDEFVTREVFRPLHMVDTCFLPAPEKVPRIAPTEKVAGEVLRGKVHDPKARQMGGVAGHAGVFATAADVARFARMMLNDGELEGARVMKPDTVKLMTSVQTSLKIADRRGLGWDIDSEYSRPRGDLFPLGSYGMTGFTGVCLWIDPFSETFWLFFSNRVHPDGSGNIYQLQRSLAHLAAEAIKGFDFHNVPGALPPRQTNRAGKP